MRSAILSVVFALVLAGSLIASTVLGGMREVEVGGLRLSVPRRWIAASPLRSTGSAQVQQFHPSGGALPVLTVWAHRPVGPIAPQRLFDQIKMDRVHGGLLSIANEQPGGPQHVTIGGTPRQVSLKPVQFGPLIGLLQHAIIYAPHAPETARTRILAVLTIDGSRYWSISLTEAFQVNPLNLQRELDAAPFDDDLFTQVIDAIQPTGYRAMTEAELAAIGLPNLPEAVVSFTEPIKVDGAGPIPGSGESALLVASDRGFRLRAMRIRRELDMADVATDLGPLLDTALVGTYWRTYGLPPTEGAIEQLDVGGASAWVLHEPKVGQPSADAQDATDNNGAGVIANGVERQLWYVRHGPGRAAVLDVVCEAGDLESTRAWVERVIADLAEMPARDKPVLSDAIERGRSLAQAQLAAALAAHAPSWSYHLIEHNGEPLGFGATGRRIDPGQDLPLRGAEAQVLSEGPAGLNRVIELRRNWAVAQDGSAFQLEAQRSIDPRVLRRLQALSQAQAEDSKADNPAVRISVNPFTNVLVGQGGRLSLVRVTQEQATGVWLVAMPGGYLRPMAEDFWPAEPMKEQATALVWMTPSAAGGQTMAPPTPCWVQMQGDRVTLRPLLALESDLVLLDDRDTARVYVVRWAWLGSHATSTRATLDQVLAAYPQHAHGLEAWRQEFESP